MSTIPVFGPASPQAKAIVDLFYIVLGVCAVIFVIVTGLITWSLIRYRAKPGAPEPPQKTGSTPIEIAWTVIPFLIVLALFGLSARAMTKSDPLPTQAKPELVIIGHQWWWEARYQKSGAVAANEIHIPTGQRWLVRLEAADVIHDFWAPSLGRKMDMVPGHPNFIWLQADQPGTYQGACAEFCGNQHAWMRFIVVAESPAEFQQWEQRQTRPHTAAKARAAKQGEELFSKLTCVNCHSVTGAAGRNAAPDLTHLVERRTLAAGILDNSFTNLVRWLKEPQALKPGCLMPDLHLTDPQASALAAYLEPPHGNE